MSKGNLDPKSQKSETSAVAPAKRLAFFGPPPLIKGENAAAYDALLASVSAAVKPADIIEEIFVCDVVDLTWEAIRMRRLKAALMIERADKPPDCSRGQNYLRGINRDYLMGDALMAETLVENIDFIERIDRLTAIAEARRIAVLREIDRHRATHADRLRQAVQQVEDAEYHVIETQSIEENTAA